MPPNASDSNLQVAASYSASACALFFKIKTASFMDRGVGLKWLSAFPGEDEFLYPPLTYLKPTGDTQEVQLGKYKFTIVEVEPTMA